MAAMQGLALEHNNGDIRTMVAVWSTARSQLTYSAEHKERICQLTAEAQLQGDSRIREHQGILLCGFVRPLKQRDR
jgi:hypothetical protein